MIQLFPLTPRYRLDDEQPWLRGIDPSRHYWIWVNGEQKRLVALPGLAVSSLEEFKVLIVQFQSLQPGDTMTLSRAASRCTLRCISLNCYAIESHLEGAEVWHLFDQETLQSLLMTAHPDWQCAPSDVELGRELLIRSWQQARVA
ncbi:MAG: hypothetical protein SFW36_15890 [Leptolyngbyaceae cyanobacterium bins.59]|nr:hypothetical protein [Leptolyngbyaceae cyanobacterium bins.59]